MLTLSQPHHQKNFLQSTNDLDADALSFLHHYIEEAGPFMSEKAESKNTAQEWYEKGFSFNYEGQYKKAIECFDSCLKSDPNHPHVWAQKVNHFTTWESMTMHTSILKRHLKLIRKMISGGITTVFASISDLLTLVDVCQLRIGIKQELLFLVCLY